MTKWYECQSPTSALSTLGHHDYPKMSGQDEGEIKQNPKRYATTGIDKNRLQLEKLMKDPSKLVVLPPPPKEKTIRPPREMMKSVQGSSAGAGSGEFHVYKANRRREYERLKAMEEQKEKVSWPIIYGPMCLHIRCNLEPDEN
jgi:hypothetical protein